MSVREGSILAMSAGWVVITEWPRSRAHRATLTSTTSVEPVDAQVATTRIASLTSRATTDVTLSWSSFAILAWRGPPRPVPGGPPPPVSPTPRRWPRPARPAVPCGGCPPQARSGLRCRASGRSRLDAELAASRGPLLLGRRPTCFRVYFRDDLGHVLLGGTTREGLGDVRGNRGGTALGHRPPCGGDLLLRQGDRDLLPCHTSYHTGDGLSA